MQRGTGRRGGGILAPMLLLLLLLILVAAACGSRAGAQTLPPGRTDTLPEALAGTHWRLVEFRSSDDGIGTQRPADASRYTMSLGENGTVSMRLDCNQVSGTWTATVSGSSFGFGPLRMTRVACQQPSLDGQIARHAEFVSSFLLRDGFLFLNLMADGGTYVWERLRE
jgi:heat shock protein HslJ